ncbi:radical SAM family heme chaperone HemW [Falsibacillus pallidus]|uniref:Heme chaperone HemW n=1 Tax=Falsibacillus pallidus TaxID=493781 RepID=A0A370GPZ1_9BACI|nr:radical SAM family heme chaperone HemW [Falsibacillus pallidus]RDI44023.1 oxygen-independent coproporphyrinogen-3 oxidase [Falsibacillus pallidus]
MIESAYIHIPFCHHICHYCDFNKFFFEGQPVDEYLASLKKEMTLAMDKYPAERLKTIFVGGGTPTALNEKQLETLCRNIREVLPFDQGEFTFEANPGDLSIEKLKILKEYGVNRLSYGVQSFNDELLKRIGRSHKAEDVYASIANAEKAGFDNISIDLIYSLPGQTLADFKETVEEALRFGLPHYSGYSLIVEPKTVFYNLMRKGKLLLPTEETEAEMYGLLMEKMEVSGLKQYEISNFAKPGFESRHNLVYWNNEQYFGFGAGAHSYTKDSRNSNYGPLKKYMLPLEEDQLPFMEQHKVTIAEKMEEEMFLGLRKTEGVSIELFEQKFGESMMDIFNAPIIEMSERQLVEIDNGHLKLTREGKFLGNEVFQSFLGVIQS